VMQRFAAAGAQTQFMGAEALTRYEEAEMRKWQTAVNYSGAKID
jgi:hypothetical protein